MNRFLCIAAETTGRQSSAALIEVGWMLLELGKGKEPAAGLHLINPGSANIEQSAVETHTESGLLTELSAGPHSSLEEVWSEIAAELAAPHDAALGWAVLWDAPFLVPFLEDSPLAPALKYAKGLLDFGTLNRGFEAWTVNPQVRPAQQRAGHKLVAMREGLEKWTSLFHLATVRLGPRPEAAE